MEWGDSTLVSLLYTCKHATGTHRFRFRRRRRRWRRRPDPPTVSRFGPSRLEWPEKRTRGSTPLLRSSSRRMPTAAAAAAVARAPVPRTPHSGVPPCVRGRRRAAVQRLFRTFLSSPRQAVRYAASEFVSARRQRARSSRTNQPRRIAAARAVPARHAP